MVGCESGSHNDLGRGQLFAVRKRGQKSDNHNIVCCRTCTEQAAAQHNNENHEQVGFESSLVGYVEHGSLKGSDEAGFLKRCNDCHELGKHYDSSVGKSAESSLNVGDAEDDKQKTGEQRRRAERQLVHHDQDDHERCDC